MQYIIPPPGNIRGIDFVKDVYSKNYVLRTALGYISAIELGSILYNYCTSEKKIYGSYTSVLFRAAFTIPWFIQAAANSLLHTQKYAIFNTKYATMYSITLWMSICKNK